MDRTGASPDRVIAPADRVIAPAGRVLVPPGSARPAHTAGGVPAARSGDTPGAVYLARSAYPGSTVADRPAVAERPAPALAEPPTPTSPTPTPTSTSTTPATSPPPAAPPVMGRLAGGTLYRRAQRPARYRIVGEVCELAVLDLVMVGAVSVLAGATAPAALIAAALTAGCLAVVGLYRRRLRHSALDDPPRLLLGVALTLAPAAWLSEGVPPGWSPHPLAWPAPGAPPIRTDVALDLAWPALVLVAVLVGRVAGYADLHRRRRRGPGEPTVVIGSGPLAVRLTEVLREDRNHGLAPLGCVGPPPPPGVAMPVPMLGRVDDLDSVVRRLRPTSLIVAFPGTPDADLVGALRRWRGAGIEVYVVPRLFELSVRHRTAELIGGVPVARLWPVHHRWQGVVKRTVDIVGALVGLLLLSPVLLGCVFAVRCESGRAGVLFRQTRIGRDGTPFMITKFRSLTPESDLESQIRWSINHDNRMGPVGRVLRATSLDELPQLFDVLRGDMSLVGPRPERPFFVERFQRAYASYRDRHRMPVGITGWAQVHGLRGDTSIEERVRYDNYYIENWTIGLDFKIIIRTVGSLLGFRGR